MASVENLVVDSGAFIKNLPIKDIGSKVYSLQKVVSEIRDKATRQRLQVLPYELTFKEPSPEAIKIISGFAKETGDYGCLSATDICLIALTYDLEKQHVGTNHLKDRPEIQKSISNTSKKVCNDKDMIGFFLPAKNQEETRSRQTSTSSLPRDSSGFRMEDVEEMVVEEEEEAEEKTCGEDDDDDDGWITPQNIKILKAEMLGVEVEQIVKVACLTTDFAMQNVMIQMGLNVVGSDGYIIQTARSYVLRCYGCCNTTTVMTKKFCPHCGNATMKRVAVTTNEDGNMEFHISTRRGINTKGMNARLPVPQGGKHGVNPLTCPDQPFPQQRPSRKSVLATRTDPLSADYMAIVSPFADNDVTSRASQLGIRARQQDGGKKKATRSRRRKK